MQKFPTFVFLIFSFELVVGPMSRFGNSETNSGTASSSADHNANLAGKECSTNQPRITNLRNRKKSFVNAENNRLVKGGGVGPCHPHGPQRRELVVKLAKKRKAELAKLFGAEFAQVGEAGVANMIRKKYEVEMALTDEGELGNMFEDELAQIGDGELAKKCEDVFAKISKAEMAKLFEYAFAKLDEVDLAKKCKAEFVKKNEAEMAKLFESELAKIGETEVANRFKTGLTMIDDAESANIREGNGFALPDDTVVVTSAYGELRNKMNVEYIAHAVGPNIRTGEPTPENRNALQACYQGALQQLLQLETRGSRSKTIAFPCISVGAFAYPAIDAAVAALEAMLNWLATTPNSGQIEEIRLIIWEGDKQNEQIYKKLIGQAKQQLENGNKMPMDNADPPKMD